MWTLFLYYTCRNWALNHRTQGPSYRYTPSRTVKLWTPICMFFIIKSFKTSRLAKKETSGNVLSIMLIPPFKKSDQQMIRKGDFLTWLSDTDMTLASDHGGPTPTNYVRHVYFEWLRGATRLSLWFVLPRNFPHIIKTLPSFLKMNPDIIEHGHRVIY